MSRERRRVHFSGRVQGVGFRFTAQRLALGFEVVGYVRNVPDGRVDLVAEGESPVLDAFLNAIHAELGGKIHTSSSSTEPAVDPTYGDFSVRY